MKDNPVKKAMDNTLSSLYVTPQTASGLLAQAKGEIKVKKKMKLSVVLALALLLVVVTAVAVVSIRETGRRMAELEQKNGNFTDWPLDDRVHVVIDLMEAGYIKKTPERQQLAKGSLSEEETLLIAHEAMEELTGEEARDASFLSIMQSAWGPFESWDYETQAWYSSVFKDAGAYMDGKTFFTVPQGGITDKQAIQIARAAIAKGYGVEESALDGYRVMTSFQIPEFAEKGDTQSYWYVEFDSWNTGMDESKLPFLAFGVFIHPDTGELLTPVEETLRQRDAFMAIQNLPVRKAIQAFYETHTERGQFYFLKMESKADWTRDIVPLIKAYIKENPDSYLDVFSLHEVASVNFHYGLPQEDALPLDKAIELARAAIKEKFALSEEEMNLLGHEGASPHSLGVSYDVTDPQKPLWKLTFGMPSIYHPDEALVEQVKAVYGKSDYNFLYQARLDAKTGEVVEVKTWPHHPNTLEDYMDIF